MKRCSRCGEAKASTEFYTELRNRNGLASRCKDCQRSTSEANRAKPRIRASLLLGAAKSRAAKRGLPLTLTFEWVLERVERGTCEVTGVALNLNPPSRKGSFNLFSPSLDRRDPSQGYTPENTAFVATGYNLLKNSAPEEEARRFLKEAAAKY